MRCLYIDTSSSFLYTAIVNNDKVEAEVKKEYGHKLSEYALPEIVSMFEKNNLNAKSIDKIIVVDGPGSFTGIRIGITIAKVYSWSLSIPITTITSLEAMSVSSNTNTYKVPILDARRKYVFAAIFDKDDNVVLQPTYLKLEELNEKLKYIENYKIITNDQFEEFKNAEKYSPEFNKIISRFKNKKSINPHAVNPNYLKLTEAEESRLQ